METRRDLLLAILALAGVCVVLAFVTIGLFVRMSPENDEEAIRQRVEMIDATQTMLGVFAVRWGEGVDQSGVARLEAQLATLREHAKGDERTEMLVSRLTDTTGRALYGERTPLKDFVEAAGEVAHARMDELSEGFAHTSRLGSAGAWAAAIGGLVMTVLAFMAYARLERRIARPARELSRVLTAARGGDMLQRCRPLDGTSELEQALMTVNVLLDKLPGHAALAPATPDAPTVEVPRPPDDMARRALAGLIEREPGAVVVYALPNAIVAANTKAMERLGGDDHLRDRITQAVADGGGPGVTVEPLEPGRLLLCRLDGV